MKKRVLISSFEPFGGELINPSQEVTNALAGEFDTITLPVSRHVAPEALIAEVRKTRPDTLIMLGECGGSAEILLERVAINLDDFPIPDHAHNQPKEEDIFPDGPKAYFSTLPLNAIKCALTQKRIPCRISNSAGTYLCNHLFYCLRHYLENSPTKAGFIHLPYLPAQAKPKPKGTPAMELDNMLHSVRTMIKTCEEASAENNLA